MKQGLHLSYCPNFRDRLSYYVGEFGLWVHNDLCNEVMSLRNIRENIQGGSPAAEARVAYVQNQAAAQVEEATESAGLTDSQVNALNKLGVNQSDHIPFMNGNVTSFQFPTTGGDDVYGFLQYQNGNLTSQLFSINNTSGGAASAFRQFITGSNDLGVSLGLDSLELQGGSVINPDLANALSSRGFTPKTVPVPDVLGGGTQEVLSKVVPVKP